MAFILVHDTRPRKALDRTIYPTMSDAERVRDYKNQWEHKNLIIQDADSAAAREALSRLCL